MRMPFFYSNSFEERTSNEAASIARTVTMISPRARSISKSRYPQNLDIHRQ